ncbi:MAG: hypothetical protein A2234_01525 [Elusimicrobia bacterium RIFOXYA2_FULL_58_8]|nr:MAG: hypothetical protein A2285_01780 [Elusimicrobia bacterium RIFOXYA12_FULL_57_11]OGS17449.1 MAG: hypothetical protein A2234_01525 [Elusimicrobia bacterium RIFOXYA2_FULL_58_8]
MPTDNPADSRAPLAANLVLLAVLAVAWQLIPAAIRAIAWNAPFDAGENWIHALTVGFNNNWFPVFPVTLAAIQYHTPAWLQTAVLKTILLLPVILSFSAATLLHSHRAGIFSAVLAAAVSCLMANHSRTDYELYMEEILISIAMLMLIGGAAIKTLTPFTRSLMLGLLSAIALYTKGVIVLFVPVLLVYELLWEKDRLPPQKHWPAAAVFLGAMAVWCLANLLSGNGFVLLENWGRTGNIATGALGLIATIEGDWKWAVDIPRGQSAAYWVAVEILSHPLRYIYAAFQRLHYLLWISPIIPGLWALFLAWLAAAFTLRKNKAVRPLILLTLYILLVHLFMPVATRYFIPAWLLVPCLTGIFLAQILGGSAAAGQEDTNARRLFFAAALPLAACWGVCVLLVATYPVRARLPHNLQKLELSHPGSPWILYMSGQQSLDSGNLDKAAAAFYKAYQLEPALWRKTEYLKMAFISGSLSGAGIHAHYREFWDVDTLFLAALRYTEEGDLAAAREVFAYGLHSCVAEQSLMRHIATEQDRLFHEKLKAGAKIPCLAHVSDLINLLGDKRRGVILSRIRAIAPDFTYKPPAPSAPPGSRAGTF